VGIGLVSALAVATAALGLSEREAKKQAEINLRTLEVELADGLLRPLGHTPGPVKPFEDESIRRLAKLPPESDRVRRLFIGRAFENLDRVNQLNQRLAMVIHAAVGLDHACADDATRLFDEILSSPAQPVKARSVAAVGLVDVGRYTPEQTERASLLLYSFLLQERRSANLRQPSWRAWKRVCSNYPDAAVDQAAAELVEMQFKDDRNDDFVINHLISDIAARVSRNRAGELAGKLVRGLSDKKLYKIEHVYLPPKLAAVLGRLVVAIPDDQVEQLATFLKSLLLDLIVMDRAFYLPEYATAFVVTTNRLAAAKAVELRRQAAESLHSELVKKCRDKGSSFQVVGPLVESLGTVCVNHLMLTADQQSELVSVLADYLHDVKDINEFVAVGKSLPKLVPCLDQGPTFTLICRLVELAHGLKEDYLKASAAVPALPSLCRHLQPDLTRGVPREVARKWMECFSAHRAGFLVTTPLDRPLAEAFVLLMKRSTVNEPEALLDLARFIIDSIPRIQNRILYGTSDSLATCLIAITPSLSPGQAETALDRFPVSAVPDQHLDPALFAYYPCIVSLAKRANPDFGKPLLGKVYRALQRTADLSKNDLQTGYDLARRMRLLIELRSALTETESAPLVGLLLAPAKKTLIESYRVDSSNLEAVNTLLSALAEFAWLVPTADRVQIAAAVMAAITPDPGDPSLSAFRSLLKHMDSPAGLLSVLRDPYCVGEFREAVLWRAAELAGRPFASVWDFIEWAPRG
jgi:hypothetical protein